MKITYIFNVYDLCYKSRINYANLLLMDVNIC